MTICAAFAATYGLVGAATHGIVSERLESRIRAEARAGATALLDVLVEQGPQAAIDAANALHRDGEIEEAAASILAADGRLLGGAEMPWPPADGAYDLLLAEPHNARDVEPFYVVLLSRQGYRIAYGYEYESAEDLLTLLVAAFAGAIALSTAIALALSLLLSRQVRGRLDGVDRAVRQAALGEFGDRAPTSSRGDLIDRLADSANRSIERLGEHVAALKRVTEDIAHELRTPIGRAMILIERAGRSTAEAEKRDLLERASDELRHLSGTFDGLLTIAQIENGARRSRFRSVDLARVAARAHEALAPVAEEAGHRLRFSAADEATLVMGDEDLLLRLTANLLENAIRHNEPGRAIDLTLRADAAMITVSVTDDGSGIPSVERERVVERFARLDRSRTRGGSGLGLALARAVADLHGGRLVLRDAEPGLTVDVILPRAGPVA